MINAYDVGACCSKCPHLSELTYGETWYKCSRGVCREFYETHGPSQVPASYFLPFDKRIGIDPRLSVELTRHIYKNTDIVRCLDKNIKALTPREA